MPIRFETLAVHGGQHPDPTTLSRGVPVYRTSSYLFKSAEHAAKLFGLAEQGNVYGRLGNPTQAMLEERMSLLEGGVGALASASGTSAIFSTIDPKSRLSSIIVIACFFAAAAPTMQFLHTSESFIWSFQVLMKAIGGNVDWWEYLNHACFINTIYVALSFLTIYFMRGKVRLPEGGKLKLILEERLAEMGPMTVSEKRLLVLAILGILGFMVEPWTGVNAVYVLCLVALFCYMPGMKIMEPSSFNNLNIVFLVFVAGCMAIGFVAGEVGANKWAVSSIIPFLKELPPTLGVLCSYLAGVVTNLLLTPFAATVAFTPAFGELGVQMGVNPLPLFYAFEYGLDQYFFPYEGVMFLYIFTTGCVTLKHVIPTMIDPARRAARSPR